MMLWVLRRWVGRQGEVLVHDEHVPQSDVRSVEVICGPLTEGDAEPSSIPACPDCDDPMGMVWTFPRVPDGERLRIDCRVCKSAFAVLREPGIATWALRTDPAPIFDRRVIVEIPRDEHGRVQDSKQRDIHLRVVARREDDDTIRIAVLVRVPALLEPLGPTTEMDFRTVKDPEVWR